MRSMKRFKEDNFFEPMSKEDFISELKERARDLKGTLKVLRQYKGMVDEGSEEYNAFSYAIGCVNVMLQQTKSSIVRLQEKKSNGGDGHE